jgi:hypothetical protein
MSITPYLDGLEVDPETKRVLSAALEMTRVSLGLADDFANGIIAKRISELPKPASGIPICYARVPSRNYASICLETNRDKSSKPSISALAALASAPCVCVRFQLDNRAFRPLARLA